MSDQPTPPSNPCEDASQETSPEESRQDHNNLDWALRFWPALPILVLIIWWCLGWLRFFSAVAGTIWFAVVVWIRNPVIHSQRSNLKFAIHFVIVFVLVYGGLHLLDSLRDEDPIEAPVTLSSPQSQATWNYWAKLRKVLADSKAEVFQAESQTNWTVAQRLDGNAALMGATIGRIDNLSTYQVDADVVALGADSMLLFSDMQQCLLRALQLVHEREQLETHANSLEAQAEALMRAFLGDPLGKLNDVRQADQHLDHEFQQALDEVQSIFTRASQLRAHEYKLRATLSRRYDCEFPSLELE